MLTTRLRINPRLLTSMSKQLQIFLLRKCRFMKRKKIAVEHAVPCSGSDITELECTYVFYIHTSYTTKSKNKGRSQKLCCESNTFYARGCMENGGHSALKFCNK